MKFQNTQGITGIRMSTKVRAFCPMGNDWYCGNVTISMKPGDIIPDYVEVDTFIKTLDGSNNILEDIVAKVFNHCIEEYCPLALDVTCYADDAVHLPVAVTKSL